MGVNFVRDELLSAPVEIEHLTRTPELRKCSHVTEEDRRFAQFNPPDFVVQPFALKCQSPMVDVECVTMLKEVFPDASREGTPQADPHSRSTIVLTYLRAPRVFECLF